MDKDMARKLVYMFMYYNTHDTNLAFKRLEVLMEVICEIQELRYKDNEVSKT